MHNTPGERFERASTGQPYKPETRRYDPRDIKIDPTWNGRIMTTPETREWIDILKESIKVDGVREAIKVKYDKKTGVKTLVAGQCRLTACLELRNEGFKVAGEPITIPCERVEGDEIELTIENFVSGNSLPFTPWEAGAEFRKLLKWGIRGGVDEIARRLCKPRRYVTECIALSNVSVEAKALLASGEVTPGAVLHAVKEHGPDAAADVLTQAVAAQPKPKEPAQASIPGTTRPVKAKPLARPKKPSAREEALKAVRSTDKEAPLATASEPSYGPHKTLHVDLCRAVLAEIPFEKQIELAIKGLECYGLKA